MPRKTKKHPSTNSPARRGGPRTAEGKARSRGNALKHGLTSELLLPKILQRSQVDSYRQRFTADMQPASALERTLIDEMARHAAMLELAEQAEPAVLRTGALEMSKVLFRGDEDAGSREDALLSAAFTTDALDRSARYRRGHEKAFYAALRQLQAIQEARREAAQDRDSANPPGQAQSRHFVDEQSCLEYLSARFALPEWRCPGCSAANGHWLSTRQRWECAACRRQIGVRAGTVMERSRLPLLVWFRAIRLLRETPDVDAAAAANGLGIARRETVRKLLRSIRTALGAPDAEVQLAGLNSLAFTVGQAT